MTQQIFPNLGRVANASPFYDAPAPDSACAGRQSTTLLDARALRCSSRHAAMRRGPVRSRANLWRAVSRIANLILAFGARPSDVLMRK